MPTLVAVGLRANEFEDLKAKKGLPAATLTSGDGRAVHFTTAPQKVTAGAAPAPMGYITEEDDSFFNGIKNWFTRNGPFPFLMIFFFYLTLVFALGDHALPGKRQNIPPPPKAQTG